MKIKVTKTVLCNLILIPFSFITFEEAWAAPVVAPGVSLPSSVEPGVVGNNLSAQPLPQPRSKMQLVSKEEKAAGTLGPAAESIKFKLNSIILEGNHVYSDRQISDLYQNKIGTTISVAELQDIVQNITNYYRNNGYVLSRAILPPQHVKNGVVRIRVIEGYVDNVKIVGQPKGARRLLQGYGDRIAVSKPLQIKVMEHYLRLANEVPGLEVKAVLEPSKVNVGASSLYLTAKEQTVTGSVSYDNYGTRYLGPDQITASAALNSIFRSGDTTRATITFTTRPHELRFYDIFYQTPVGTRGLALTFGKNRSATVPGLNLAPLDVVGTSETYYGLVQYPIIRSRDQNLTFDGSFNYLDSKVTTFGALLYNDHLRTLKAGVNYDFADKHKGSNIIGVHAEQGLPILGATHNTSSFTTSRFGGRGDFSKVLVQYARLQQMFWRLSAYFVANGQYAFNPLLSEEQFGFGGSQLGRGYDPAEIIGDRGLAGSIELRADFAPSWRLVQTVEPYIFYDAGKVWNVKNVPGTFSEQSATSAGVGTRFIFTRFLSGNLMISQPLTKPIFAETFVGEGKNPRIQFSVAASG